MTEQNVILNEWITVSLIGAAFFATLFPLMYAFSPWYKSNLGRALMYKAIAFALAVDLTLVFQIFEVHYATALWLTAITYTLIAGTTASLAFMLWYNNFYIKDHDDDSK